jgi:hypothetical protein
VGGAGFESSGTKGPILAHAETYAKDLPFREIDPALPGSYHLCITAQPDGNEP